jgi:3-deoxy-D-manno-octulosonate 8-phosphate phosphatase (KDO 8-P phosphatase)
LGNFDPLLLERAARVQLLALDVDGVLTDGRLYFDRHGNELKAFHTRDGLGLKALQACGIAIALITGRESEMVTQRAASLGIEHVYQGADNKLDAYLDLLAKTALDDAQVCFAGDDWVDLPLLRRCGLAVTVPAADEALFQYAHWVTPREGGMGAVRDICNLILVAQGHYQQLLLEHGG